jgi:D-3-phosphoglycerate dehydrogenase / 2-oxoglutarate reductase
MLKRVLITAEIHPYLQQRFETLGFSVDVYPETAREKLLEIVADYSVLIITTYTKVDKLLIDKAVNLKLIGRVGSGMENIDINYCKEKNIICLNSPEGNANAVGEHCLAMLLNLLNNITKAGNELKNNLFLREENRGEELDGKTVGIIGFGNTGSAFAKKLRGFAVDLLVYDKYKTATENPGKNTTIKEIQEKCDIISFHVPYNTETHHYCNDHFIAGCLKSPFIINTSRGAIIHTAAIISALENNKIRGLCTDVFEDEPVTKNEFYAPEIYHHLFSFKNVVATPHIAGWTIESKYKLVKILMDKIEAESLIFQK